MDTGSFSVRSLVVRSLVLQTQDDALRHLNVLTQALKKVALAGLVGGIGCGVIASLLQRSLGNNSPQGTNSPGLPELSGITAVAGFIAVALIVFSIAYLIASWGLSRRQIWARYAAAAVFVFKVLLCVWLGRASLGSMIVFAMIASLDLYGLWVLLANEAGQLFSAAATSHAGSKPANLVI